MFIAFLSTDCFRILIAADCFSFWFLSYNGFTMMFFCDDQCLIIYLDFFFENFALGLKPQTILRLEPHSVEVKTLEVSSWLDTFNKRGPIGFHSLIVIIIDIVIVVLVVRVTICGSWASSSQLKVAQLVWIGPSSNLLNSHELAQSKNKNTNKYKLKKLLLKAKSLFLNKFGKCKYNQTLIM